MSEQARQKPGILRRYIFSLDHKVIGIQYFCLALVAALTGVLLSLLMRLRIAWPTAKWPLLESIFPTGFQGGQMQPEFYLAKRTMSASSSGAMRGRPGEVRNLEPSNFRAMSR